MSDEPLTPARAARECAEGLVTIRDGAESYHRPYALMIGKYLDEGFTIRADAEGEATLIRAAVAPAVQAAIERYARSLGGLPSPLSDEWLEDIDAARKDWREAGSPDAAVDGLYAEVLHLRACLREIVRSGCEPEAYALGMKRGEALGARKQREADAVWLRNRLSWFSELPPAVDHDLVEGLKAAPLVTETEDKP